MQSYTVKWTQSLAKAWKPTAPTKSIDPLLGPLIAESGERNLPIHLQVKNKDLYMIYINTRLLHEQTVKTLVFFTPLCEFPPIAQRHGETKEHAPNPTRTQL